MKKIVGILVGVMMFSSIAMASPLMDYSQGKGSIDLTWRNSQNGTQTSDGTGTYPKKYTLDGSITLGFAKDFAFQYRNFNSKSGTFIDPLDATSYYKGIMKLNTNEFNIHYKIDKNVSVFTGILTFKGDCPGADVLYASGTSYANYSNSENRKLWQIGVVASTAIADKTTLWGSVAAGKDLLNWEVGVGYQISPDWEFNINYRKVDIKRSLWTDNLGYQFRADTTAKGVGFGVTYKF